MIRKLVAVVLAVLLLGAISGTAFAADPAQGKINGTLANKTANGSSVADVEVTLGTYKGSDDAGKKTVKSDKSGKFVFDGLDTSADFTYQVSVNFQNAPYYSDPINFSGAAAGGAPSATPTPPSTEQNITVNVFDSTTDDSVLKSASHHYLLEGDKNGISVTEIAIITNSADKSYVGKESHSGANTTLRFSLPDGATDFEPVDGLYPSRVLQVAGGFVDTMPVYPGMSQRVWRFSIPPTGDSAVFSAKLDMATDKVSVLIPDEGAKVSVDGLAGPTNQDIQGDKYLLFSGQNLAANTQFKFTLDNLSNIKPQQPQQPTQAGTSQGVTAPASSAVSPALIGGVLLVIVVVIGGAGFTVARRRKKANQHELAMLEEEDDSADFSGDPEAERQALVAAIARLDDLFEQDKITSEEYGRLRTEKKKRLIALSRSDKNPVGTGSRK